MLDQLSHLIQKTKKHGADAADVLCVVGQGTSVQTRMGQVEKIERTETQDIGLRVFIGKRQAVVSTTSLNPDSFDSLIDQAIAMARVVPEDEFAGLVPSDSSQTPPVIADLFDPTVPAEELIIQKALGLEQAALDVSGITNSEGANVYWGQSEVFLVNSLGFSGTYKRSHFGQSLSVIAQKNGQMESDYDYDARVFFNDLTDVTAMGHELGDRTVKRLGAKKVKTQQVPVVFDSRVARSLIGDFASAINGAAIARGTSFLRDSMNQALFNDSIQIIDDPFLVKGPRSRAFDAEGVIPQKRLVIDQGVLQTWLLDGRSARQLGLKTTGNASRSPASTPSPTPSNFYLQAGTQSPQELMKEMQTGLYVTDVMGQGVNLLTGDYSLGIRGFWIEKGEQTYPVAEITIASHLKEMFHTLTPANDLQLRFGIESPTVRIEAMMIAGS